MRLTKQQRQDAFARARSMLVQRIYALSDRSCLGWYPRSGWHTVKGAKPDDNDIRRVRLLHVGQKTYCWLFKSQGQFVARWSNGSVQTSGTSARDALSGLRIAVLQYRRVYDGDHSGRTQQPNFAAVLPPLATLQAQAAVKLLVLHRVADGFWWTTTAGMAQARMCFQRMRGCPGR